MLKQTNLKNKEMSEMIKQPNFKKAFNQEDSEDEPLPMDYSKMKSIASKNNQTSDRNTKAKKNFESNFSKVKKAEENKQTEIFADEEEDEIQIPISNQIKQLNNQESKHNSYIGTENHNNYSVTDNKYGSYNTTRNNIPKNFKENLDIQNVNSLKTPSVNENIFPIGDEEEDKPINLSDVKKLSLDSQVKNNSLNKNSLNSNDSGNHVKSPQSNVVQGNLSEVNFYNQNSNPPNQHNEVNRKAYTKLSDRNKSNDRNVAKDKSNNKTNKIPKNENFEDTNKKRTTSQKRFEAEVEDNYNIYNKENTPNKIMKSINNPSHNYNTVNQNSAPLLENQILNYIERNLISNTDLENKSIKSANLWEYSVQPKRGDLTPKSIESDPEVEKEKENKNEIKEKTEVLQEKEYIGTITLSELEENACVNVGIEYSQKNTTMNDLRLNSILVKDQFNENELNNDYNNNSNNNISNHLLGFDKNKGNYDRNEKDQAEKIYQILNQNKTATFKKTQEQTLKSGLMNSKGESDQTSNFFEYRNNDNNNKTSNQKSNLESNFSSKSFKTANNKNNNLSVSENNYTNNNTNNVSRSDINYTQNNLKTQNSKMLLTESKYAQYDTQNLCYELIREYSHLKIDKDEDFMRRMLFDIFKRQTKEERMEKLVEQNKVKIDENDRIRTFNRLIEDANRRIEAQDHMEEMKLRLDMNNVNSKKYKFDEWEEIYQDRFLNYQKYKEQWIEERQREKKELEALREQEVIETCKTVKKPKEEIEQSVQRMYNEAERRQIKMDIKKNKNKIDDNKIDIEDFLNISNNLNTKEPRNMTPTVFKPVQNKNNKKQTNHYQFQSDMSGNENSEDESNNFLSKVKVIKERNNASNSSPKKKSPAQKPNYVNQNALIKESANEDLEEASVEINHAYNNNKKILNANNSNNKSIGSNYTNNNNNQKAGWNSFHNSQNPKHLLNNKLPSNNTDINNKRFEIDPMENKRSVVNKALNKNNNNNSNIINSAKNASTNEKPSVVKNYKSKNNNPINAVPEHLKNLEEFEENEMHSNNNNYNSYALKYEMHNRPMSRGSYNNPNQKNFINANKGEHNLKHMPDHLATKLVDEILNSKFSEGD